MTTQQLINQTKKLIAIPSTADNPAALREALDLMVKSVLDSGKEITIEQFESGGKPSFLAYRGKQRPDNFRVILNGHLDVVPGKPEQYNARVTDGKLYGRGAYDMKAAGVILADAFCEFVDKVPYALGLQIVTDEESSGIHGTKYQIKNGVRGDFVICGECGRAPERYEIANEAKGIAIIELGFSGRSSHAAYPWRADNAASKASRFVQALHGRFPEPKAEAEHTTITVTAIEATGEANTKTADYATVKLDARYVANDPNFRSKRHVAALIEEIDPNARVVAFQDFSSPLYTSPDNPLLLSLKASAEKVEGTAFSFARRHATSDGRFYGDVGDQACEFGIAGENQHAQNEYITLKAFGDYRATIRDFLTTTITTEAENTNTVAFTS
jgi:succinyl-diaminopimelate desuccinylase